MAYKSGQLKIGNEYDSSVWPIPDDWDRSAYLPHSCDSWVIGGPDQVKALISDLQQMLANWDTLPDERDY